MKKIYISEQMNLLRYDFEIFDDKNKNKSKMNLFLISDKSVSFEKSVSFSDDIQGVQKSHTPQHPGKSFSLKITAV